MMSTLQSAAAMRRWRGAAVHPSAFPSSGATSSESIVPGVLAPPLAFEWWYYAQVVYAVFGTALGVSVGFVGAGLLALLAVACVLHMGGRPLALLLPLALPLAFGLTYLATQIIFFHESIVGSEIRPVIAWLLGTVVIQCLALRRGFLHRFVLVAWLIGLGTIPFMTLYRGSQTRFGLTTGIGIANPNDLSAWFGFCALYLVIVALETKRTAIRVMAAVGATGGMFAMALTVSRGPLFALAVAFLFAMRGVLRRGLFALLPLVIAAWIAYGTGLFDDPAAQLASRGLEESGRFLVWPLAIARFLHDPLTGVGVSHVGTYVAEKTIELSPHNQFIFVALAAGLIPLVFFVAYWIDLARWAVKMRTAIPGEAAFLLPLLLYALLIGLQLNQPYMMPWSMVIAGTVAANGFALKARQHLVRRQRHRAWS